MHVNSSACLAPKSLCGSEEYGGWGNAGEEETVPQTMPKAEESWNATRSPPPLPALPHL